MLVVSFLYSTMMADGAPPRGGAPGAETLAALERARTRFYYAGSPIHPLIVRDLRSLPSDGGDQVVAVNLSGAHRSNRYCCEGGFKFEEKNGVLRAELDFERDFSAESVDKEDCWNGCWFSYERLGADDSDAQILVVRERTGGSGIFTSLLLLRFRIQDLGLATDRHGNYSIGGKRLLLEKIGELPLGEDIDAKVELAGVILEVNGDNVRLVRIR